MSNEKKFLSIKKMIDEDKYKLDSDLSLFREDLIQNYHLLDDWKFKECFKLACSYAIAIHGTQSSYFRQKINSKERLSDILTEFSEIVILILPKDL